MRYLLTLLIIFSFSFFSHAQKAFPDIEGKCLNEKMMSIPNDTKGKMTLVGIAFSKKSEEDLRTWFRPTYSTFINPPKSSLIPVDDYDVNLIFIPMLKGLAKGASGKIFSEMQEGIDKEFHPHVMLFDGNFIPYKNELNFGEKDLPYFFVLDAEGKILYETSGAYTEEKFEEITDFFVE
jgi:hypothetical protein